jgi:hypothetical protein
LQGEAQVPRLDRGIPDRVNFGLGLEVHRILSL